MPFTLWVRSSGRRLPGRPTLTDAGNSTRRSRPTVSSSRIGIFFHSIRSVISASAWTAAWDNNNSHARRRLTGNQISASTPTMIPSSDDEQPLKITGSALSRSARMSSRSGMDQTTPAASVSRYLAKISTIAPTIPSTPTSAHSTLPWRASLNLANPR